MIITACAPPRFFAQTHIFSVSLSSFSLSFVHLADIVINIITHSQTPRIRKPMLTPLSATSGASPCFVFV